MCPGLTSSGAKLNEEIECNKTVASTYIAKISSKYCNTFLQSCDVLQCELTPYITPTITLTFHCAHHELVRKTM